MAECPAWAECLVCLNGMDAVAMQEMMPGLPRDIYRQARQGSPKGGAQSRNKKNASRKNKNARKSRRKQRKK